MRDDLELIKIERPDTNELHIYGMGDLHVGSEQFDERAVRKKIQIIQDDPIGYVECFGDRVVITPTGTKGFKYNSTWDELEFTTTKPMCIGTTRANLTTSAKMKGTFFGNIIVKDANGIRFKGVPCIRTADNTVGYYDTVSETFYEPNGTPPTYTE